MAELWQETAASAAYLSADNRDNEARARPTMIGTINNGQGGTGSQLRTRLIVLVVVVVVRDDKGALGAKRRVDDRCPCCVCGSNVRPKTLATALTFLF